MYIYIHIYIHIYVYIDINAYIMYSSGKNGNNNAYVTMETPVTVIRFKA
jgi:hypothetical protein